MKMTAKLLWHKFMIFWSAFIFKFHVGGLSVGLPRLLNHDLSEEASNRYKPEYWDSKNEPMPLSYMQELILDWMATCSSAATFGVGVEFLAHVVIGMEGLSIDDLFLMTAWIDKLPRRLHGVHDFRKMAEFFIKNQITERMEVAGFMQYLDSLLGRRVDETFPEVSARVEKLCSVFGIMKHYVEVSPSSEDTAAVKIHAGNHGLVLIRVMAILKELKKQSKNG